MHSPSDELTEKFLKASQAEKLAIAGGFLTGMTDMELGELLIAHHHAGWPNRMIRIIGRMLNEF